MPAQSAFRGPVSEQPGSALPPKSRKSGLQLRGDTREHADFDETRYAALLIEYRPRPIHTDEEKRRATGVLQSLNAKEAVTREQAILAELLTTLIDVFEERPTQEDGTSSTSRQRLARTRALPKK